MSKERPEKESVYKSTYNPFLRMRSKKNHKDKDHKTAVLIDPDVISPKHDADALTNKLKKHFSAIPGHRPVAKIGSPALTPLKRPGSVYSPGGTKYGRHKSYGFILIFSNSGEIEEKRLPPDLTNSSWEDILKPIESPHKEREVIITSEYLNKMHKKHKKAGKRGTNNIPDQQTTMALPGVNKKLASATTLAQELGIAAKHEDWEWLHLIAFMLQGRAAQNPKNMSGGTKHCNTDMIFAEDTAINITRCLNSEVRLTVRSEEMGAHFSRQISYTLNTDHFTLRFVFDPQTSIQPSYRNRSYIDALVEVLISHSLPLLEPEGENEEKIEKEAEAKKEKEAIEREKAKAETEEEKEETPPQMQMLFFSHTQPIPSTQNTEIQPTLANT